MSKFDKKPQPQVKFDRKTDLRFDRPYHTTLEYDDILRDDLFEKFDTYNNTNELLRFSIVNNISLNCLNKNKETLIFRLLTKKEGSIEEDAKINILKFLL